MQKIILLGKLDRTAEELYKEMSRTYSIQLCTQQGEILRDIFRIISPDMILINAAQKDDISAETMNWLMGEKRTVPIVILGTKEVCDQYENYNGVVFIYRPVSVSYVADVCFKQLESKKEEKVKEKAEPAKEKEESVKLKHILIVDDSAVTLRSVKSLLDKKYRVSVATSGEMALRTMERCLPDMVLLDYEMPGCNGKQTLEMIREREEMKNVPVMFLTGVADKQHIAAVLKLNPAGYLLKPPEKEKLLEAIEMVLRGEKQKFINGL